MITFLFNRKKIRFSQRRGMTLVELLVVSAIMVLLMSIAVPVLSPIAESRLARESARGVVTAMESARSRAMQSGRPCGVAFMPFHANYLRSCIQVEQLSARPAYIGTYTVNGNTITVKSPNSNIKLHKGDTVQLNYTGPCFVIQSDNNSDTATINLAAGFDSSLKYDYSNYGSNSNECVINTFPVFESENAFAKALGIVTSFILPKGYIVDLSCSGYGNASSSESIQVTNTKRPPMIIFNPDGSAVLYSNGKPLSVASNNSTNPPKIFLLVGKWDQMEGITLENGAVRNNLDYDSFWIVVDPKTSRITMAQNIDQGLTNNILSQEYNYGVNR